MFTEAKNVIGLDAFVRDLVREEIKAEKNREQAHADKAKQEAEQARLAAKAKSGK